MLLVAIHIVAGSPISVGNFSTTVSALSVTQLKLSYLLDLLELLWMQYLDEGPLTCNQYRTPE